MWSRSELSQRFEDAYRHHRDKLDQIKDWVHPPQGLANTTHFNYGYVIDANPELTRQYWETVRRSDQRLYVEVGEDQAHHSIPRILATFEVSNTPAVLRVVPPTKYKNFQTLTLRIYSKDLAQAVKALHQTTTAFEEEEVFVPNFVGQTGSVLYDWLYQLGRTFPLSFETHDKTIALTKQSDGFRVTLVGSHPQTYPVGVLTTTTTWTEDIKPDQFAAKFKEQRDLFDAPNMERLTEKSETTIGPESSNPHIRRMIDNPDSMDVMNVDQDERIRSVSPAYRLGFAQEQNGVLVTVLERCSSPNERPAYFVMRRPQTHPLATAYSLLLNKYGYPFTHNLQF